MQITFLGAVETVTGSKYLITHGSRKILVDCGLFQGYKELRLRNWDKLPIDPASIDAVLITHAHIDHSGYLPLLVKNGFKGTIYTTPGTKALCEILLPDSGHLQEEDARNANKHGYSKHHPALPLYTEEDARQALTHFATIDFENPTPLFDDLSFCFFRSGHIIGSAFIKLTQGKTTVLFTGDLGRPHDPVMREPTIIQSVDYLITESSYGNRLHDSTNPQPEIGAVINKTIKRGGSVIIPAFAVGRAQSILYYIYQLKKNGEIPANIPVYLDSPMAISATKILCQFKNEHRLNDDQCKKMCESAVYVNDANDSKILDQQVMPKIIISASGMGVGGRILYHLKTYAPDHHNTILFTGYQAGGTRGARILNGEREVKIHGEMIHINANIESITSTSAHADYQEILDWCAKFTRAPKKVFITHGEPEAADSLKIKLTETLGWTCIVPHYQQTETLK